MQTAAKDFKFKIFLGTLAVLPFLLQGFETAAIGATGVPNGANVMSTLDLQLSSQFAVPALDLTQCSVLNQNLDPAVETSSNNITPILAHLHHLDPDPLGTVSYNANADAAALIAASPGSGWNFGNYGTTLPGAFGTPGSYLSAYQNFQFQSPLFKASSANPNQYSIDPDAFQTAFGFAPGEAPSLSNGVSPILQVNTVLF